MPGRTWQRQAVERRIGRYQLPVESLGLGLRLLQRWVLAGTRRLDGRWVAGRDETLRLRCGCAR